MATLQAGLNNLAFTHVAPRAVKLSNQQPRLETADHLFVNNVRFWSMVAIIAVHCLGSWGDMQNAGSHVLQIALIEIFKFGTIAFYFISGFLLGERLEQYSPGKYFGRRVQKTAAPWILWLSIFIIITLSEPIVRQGHLPAMKAAAASFLSVLNLALFHSTYWFVPNFLLSLAIILLFRRFLDDWRFGAILLAASLFYGVNVHFCWIPADHTKALFGFVFYQWLGVWAARHGQLLFSQVTKLNLPFVLACVLLTGALVFAETRQLLTSVPSEAMNTLKISNQLYSLAVLLGLLRIKRSTWPSFIDVRSHTFGLYLIHLVSLTVLIPVVQLAGKLMFGIPFSTLFDPHALVWRNPLTCLLMWIGTFGLVYAVSLGISMFLAAHGRLSWTVGQPKKRVTKRPLANDWQTAPVGSVELA